MFCSEIYGKISEHPIFQSCLDKYFSEIQESVRNDIQKRIDQLDQIHSSRGYWTFEHKNILCNIGRSQKGTLIGKIYIPITALKLSTKKGARLIIGISGSKSSVAAIYLKPKSELASGSKKDFTNNEIDNFKKMTDECGGLSG